MRFYLDRRRDESYYYGATTPDRDYDSDEYGSDWSNDRRNRSYFPVYHQQSDCSTEEDGDSQINIHENPEEAGNDNTPINRLPHEVMEHIFEIHMEDFRRVDSYDSDSEEETVRRVLDKRSVMVGVHRSQRQPLKVLENRDRTEFLNNVGRVCRQWLSVAGPLCRREVVVDGNPVDFQNAASVLGSPFVSLTESRGSYVHDLRVEIKSECDSEIVVANAINVVRSCSNLLRLSIVSFGPFDNKLIASIWKDGIAPNQSSLQSLTFSVGKYDSDPTNTAIYLGGMLFLTELHLTEGDAEYTLPELDAIVLPCVKRYFLRARHSAILRFQAKWSFSSLVHLGLDIGYGDRFDYSFDEEAVVLFMESHGQKLLYLEMDAMPCSSNVMAKIMIATPSLLQLEIGIDYLLYNNGCLRHNNLQLLLVDGFRLKKKEGSNPTIGAYMARFLQQILCEDTFTALSFIQMKDISSIYWGDGLGADDREVWDKWFAMGVDRRPEIVDSHSHPLTRKNVTFDPDLSIISRRRGY